MLESVSRGCLLGGCLLWGVSGPGGCLLPRGVSAPRGLSAPRGVSAPGGLDVCSQSGLLGGGGCIPAFTEADPPCEQNDKQV